MYLKVCKVNYSASFFFAPANLSREVKPKLPKASHKTASTRFSLGATSMCVNELAIIVTQRLTDDRRPTNRLDDTESPVPIKLLKKLIFSYLKVSCAHQICYVFMNNEVSTQM